MSTGRRSWDRRKAETDYKYEQFLSYLEFGPGIRSIRLVAELYGRSPRTVERDCVAHDWVQRARDWDVWKTDLQQAENERQLKLASAEAAKKLHRVEKEITDTHFKAYRQARNRLLRLIEQDKLADEGKTNKRPATHEWRAIEASLLRMLGLGLVAEQRLKNRLLASSEQQESANGGTVENQVMSPEIAAAALGAVAAVSGQHGPVGPAEGWPV